jgi:hypothetical protein
MSVETSCFSEMSVSTYEPRRTTSIVELVVDRVKRLRYFAIYVHSL